jgi:hypothetical protein
MNLGRTRTVLAATGAAALLACSAVARAAGDAAGGPVAAFLAALPPPTQAAIPFVETRMSSLLKDPIEVRGEIRVGADGTIDKQVFAPAAERLQISAHGVSIERNGQTRRLDLASDRRWRAFHAGLAGLLTRDAATLQAAFDVTLDESPDGWSLQLRPRAGGGRSPIRLISATGRGPQLLRLRVEQDDNDWQDMSFRPAGN